MILCNSENRVILPDEISANKFWGSYVKLIKAIIPKTCFLLQNMYLIKMLFRNFSFLINNRATWWWFC